MRLYSNRLDIKALPRNSLLIFLTLVGHSLLSALELSSPVNRLISSLCLDCHDAETETRLDFSKLNFQLADTENFRTWVQVYDQIDSVAMPPEKKSRRILNCGSVH